MVLTLHNSRFFKWEFLYIWRNSGLHILALSHLMTNLPKECWRFLKDPARHQLGAFHVYQDGWVQMGVTKSARINIAIGCHRAVSFYEIRLLIPQLVRQDATARILRLQMLDQSEPWADKDSFVFASTSFRWGMFGEEMLISSERRPIIAGTLCGDSCPTNGEETKAMFNRRNWQAFPRSRVVKLKVMTEVSSI